MPARSFGAGAGDGSAYAETTPRSIPPRITPSARMGPFGTAVGAAKQRFRRSRHGSCRGPDARSPGRPRWIARSFGFRRKGGPQAAALRHALRVGVRVGDRTRVRARAAVVGREAARI